MSSKVSYNLSSVPGFDNFVKTGEIETEFENFYDINSEKGKNFNDTNIFDKVNKVNNLGSTTQNIIPTPLQSRLIISTN
jgi:hypothetical protein